VVNPREDDSWWYRLFEEKRAEATKKPAHVTPG
jgi:hypothetical protein